MSFRPFNRASVVSLQLVSAFITQHTRTSVEPRGWEEPGVICCSFMWICPPFASFFILSSMFAFSLYFLLIHQVKFSLSFLFALLSFKDTYACPFKPHAFFSRLLFRSLKKRRSQKQPGRGRNSTFDQASSRWQDPDCISGDRKEALDSIPLLVTHSVQLRKRIASFVPLIT